jgi:hypothetical protein
MKVQEVPRERSPLLHQVSGRAYKRCSFWMPQIMPMAILHQVSGRAYKRWAFA